ncbi:hypothetical protein [Brevundimonas nasdae]|jgi:hypothetical protein|uniref:hypothetical protein n=1 Tax=Brevundimonas nasdae TaxID=172043 RepID=UPI00301726A4
MIAPPFAVAVVGKTDKAEVRVSLDIVKGVKLVDMRVFAPFTASNILMPTKEGLSIRPEFLTDLIDALKKAHDQACEMGWIGGAA